MSLNILRVHRACETAIDAAFSQNVKESYDQWLTKEFPDSLNNSIGLQGVTAFKTQPDQSQALALIPQAPTVQQIVRWTQQSIALQKIFNTFTSTLQKLRQHGMTTLKCGFSLFKKLEPVEASALRLSQQVAEASMFTCAALEELRKDAATLKMSSVRNPQQFVDLEETIVASQEIFKSFFNILKNHPYAFTAVHYESLLKELELGITHFTVINDLTTKAYNIFVKNKPIPLGTINIEPLLKELELGKTYSTQANDLTPKTYHILFGNPSSAAK